MAAVELLFCLFRPGELVRDRDGVPALELDADAVPDPPVADDGAVTDEDGATVVPEVVGNDAAAGAAVLAAAAAAEDSVALALAFISSAVATRENSASAILSRNQKFFFNRWLYRVQRSLKPLKKHLDRNNSKYSWLLVRTLLALVSS